MEDDLIVVDDIDFNTPRPSTSANGSSSFLHGSSRPKSVAERAIAPTTRLRSGSNPPGRSSENTERTTRSSARSRMQPKLKLKLSEKAAAQAPGMSFLGQYDRELDSSDDEDLAFEEQFILRMPPGEDLEKLRKMVESRETSPDVWFKFRDSRRAEFHIGNNTYSAKLVDLPCIIESQKTLDNKQMFKVADICQMLVVEDNKLESDDQGGNRKDFNIEEFIWPHGITPPLHHVRKRRFRKRVNKRTIESVEQEVERLLDEDSLASDVKYDVLENVNPDLSDSEFIEQAQPIDAPTPAMSDMGDAPTPGSPMGYEGEGDEEEPDVDDNASIDEELAAALNEDLEAEGSEGGDEDDDEDEDEESDDDDEDVDDEEVQARRLLNEEIRDLEAAVAKKGVEIASSANPLIKKRFEDALKKLTVDLEMKRTQRDEMKEMKWRKKEGISVDTVEDMDAGNGGNSDDGDVEEEGDDLFGDESGPNMDVS